MFPLERGSLLEQDSLRKSLYLALAICGALILVGAKLLYVAESVLCPLDDYVPSDGRGALHGFRIPGGIVLLGTLGPLLLRAIGLPWRQFGDTTIVVVPVTLACIRLACFLNGCCFGRVSDVPWSLEFPEGSWVFWFQVSNGWLSPSSDA